MPWHVRPVVTQASKGEDVQVARPALANHSGSMAEPIAHSRPATAKHSRKPSSEMNMFPGPEDPRSGEGLKHKKGGSVPFPNPYALRSHTS